MLCWHTITRQLHSSHPKSFPREQAVRSQISRGDPKGGSTRASRSCDCCRSDSFFFKETRMKIDRTQAVAALTAALVLSASTASLLSTQGQGGVGLPLFCGLGQSQASRLCSNSTGLKKFRLECNRFLILNMHLTGKIAADCKTPPSTQKRLPASRVSFHAIYAGQPRVLASRKSFHKASCPSNLLAWTYSALLRVSRA